ncbi:DUF3048 domain-containing protein [Actinacidiphila bryophytorum]|uniref:DUF3048 domain-containing protein n=1 Tax=Actinacidiphila bryophytorum TaxID=1436133 RepID=UPI002176C07B|nr:DUF3048 domain-containing protein [Actinacidiphila bryophytorum]UWE08568.1 DUF3048 domain-containing protein [Actinacidiphila bryophytorum]
MRRVRARGVWAAVAGAAALALVAAGCTGKDAAPQPTRGAAVSYLTGQAGGAGQILAVKIDNVPAARPQTGLDDAAIVYAIEVEGGLSRLMAVYDAGHLPPVVGPVRSARETDLQLLAEYDKPALAFSGAQSKLLPVLRSSTDLTAVTGTKDFYRSHDRPAPHNEYLRPAAAAAKGGAAKDIGLRFAAAVPAGGTPATTASAKMPAARFSFAWNGSRYRVSMDGKQSPWTADNVIVQHVAVKESDYHSRTGFVPFSQTVGHGSAQILRDGRSYAAVWDRPAASDGTAYTVGGHTLPLHPGRTWIVLEP